MQKQYKFYKVDQNAMDSILPVLCKYSYKCVNNYVVAIEYDYMSNSYKELLESMSELPVSQYIFTTSVFYKILINMMHESVEIYDIKLNSLFEEDNKDIAMCINKINKQNREQMLDELLTTLKWYNYDEGIDISYMSFGVICDEQICNFHFYNNGIIAIDSGKSIEKIFGMLKSIL